MGEIERQSKEIERVPRHVIVPREGAAHRRRYADEPQENDEYASERDRGYDGESGSDWARLKPLLQRHPVTAACIALIVVSLIWKAAFISHYYFHDDDFDVFDVALRSKLSWSYLTHDDAGHLFPGVYALAWVLARTALYSWAAASAVTLVMTAAASLAAWKLLRTLLGNRPAILIPLALYVLSPVEFPLISWWITAVEAIPLQIAVFMALDSHVHYVRTGRFRYACAAAGWLVFGLIFFEKAVAIPLLLFAVTAAFLTRRPLLSSIWLSLIRLWKAWLLYIVLLGGYAVVLVGALHAAKIKSTPSSLHQAATFAGELMRDTFLPSIFGGPWHWFVVGQTNPGSAPPSVLATASTVAVAIIVVASILVRRRAWRAWAILAGWIILDDVLPVAIGRLAFPGADVLLGFATRYVSDVPAVLAIAVALAFWPVAGPQEEPASSSARRPRQFFTGRWQAVAVGLCCVLVVGSLWSVTALEDVTSGSLVRSYVATAQEAIAEAPSGTVIYGGVQVPNLVVNGTFGQAAASSFVLSPMSHRGAALHWTTQLQGTFDHLMVFGQSGQLYPVGINNDVVATVPRPLKKSCTSRKTGLLTIPFTTPTSIWTVMVQIPYIANPAAAGQHVTVTYGNTVRQIAVQPGTNNAYMPVAGSASVLTFQGAPSFEFCPGVVYAGQITAPAAAATSGIPAAPVPG